MSLIVFALLAGSLPAQTPELPLVVAAADTARPIAEVADSIFGRSRAAPRMVGFAGTVGLKPAMLADSVPQGLVEYSELYGVRADIHRYVSWAMIPLFVGSAVTGFQLRNKGDDAPQWTRDLHGPLAGATAVMFGINTLTGVWNLIEGRKDPEGRGKRILHGVLFLAAGAGFAYVTAEGDNIHSTGRGNHWHRDVALGSMTVSLVSWSMMTLFK